MSNKKDRHYDKALYRLLTIMVMVLKDERPTIKSLAEEFNVSIRTIQKDIYQRLSMFHFQKDSYGQLYLEDGSFSDLTDKFFDNQE